MEALGINAGNLFVNIICFVIAFILLAHFVVGPIQKMMDKRKDVIEKGFEDAKVAAEMRENIESERQKVLDQTQKEAAQILTEAHAEAEKLKADYRDSVDKTMAKEMAISRDNIEKERDQMLSEMRGQIVDIAVGGARKLVDDSLLDNEAKQHQLMTEILTGLTSSTQAGIAELPDSLSFIEVITAIPLSDDEKKQLEAEFAPKTVKSASFKYKVDPKLIGGMIIHAGERVMDMSVNGKAQTLKEALS